MMIKLHLLTLLSIVGIYILKATSAARILIIQPYSSKSQNNFHTGIARSLLSAGHHVTSVSPYPEAFQHSNYTAIDCSERKGPAGFGSNETMSMNESLELSNSKLILFQALFEALKKQSRHVINLDEVQKIIKSETKLFDVLILNSLFELSECLLPIVEKFDIPVIGTFAVKSWLKTEWMVGNPYHPATFPSEFAAYSYPMTYFQRLDNTWHCLMDLILYQFYYFPEMKKIYQESFPQSNFENRRKFSLIFLNNHQLFSPRPMLPTIINIGGIHVEPPKPLPKNLQNFIDEAEHGVILFSFGSYVMSHTMPTQMLSVFRETFARIPQRVIWKTDGEVASLSKNVLLTKWLPQRDILAHKNVVAFMTHCGIGGLYEGLYSRVPMILLPLFTDQSSNAAVLHRLGVGLSLDISYLTADKLLNALNEVINNTRYREKITEVSHLLNDQPMSNEETVVYWTEYVIRHNGTKHLQSPALDMPLYQYLLLDVIGLILLIILVILASSYFLLKKMYNYVGKKSVHMQKSKTN